MKFEERRIVINRQEQYLVSANPIEWKPLSELLSDGWERHGGVLPSAWYEDECTIIVRRSVPGTGDSRVACPA
jgi:hypothetical protein